MAAGEASGTVRGGDCEPTGAEETGSSDAGWDEGESQPLQTSCFELEPSPESGTAAAEGGGVVDADSRTY